ncbi:MAG: hypothetical protein HKN47_15145 [Pirellulaceae bacterium]|nr:hypothetical protein [Pirellulaceae bacterium]
MSVSAPSNRNPDLLSVPDSLQQQLSDFRSKVWTTKLAEAFAIAFAAVLIAFLTVFAVDRFWDTPAPIRMAIFVVTLAAWLVIPWAVHRWVWRHRRLDQLARLLRVREPNIGDQLLGVIELADSETEQARSRRLCEAAIEQVAQSAKTRDLNQAAPRSRVRLWGSVLAVTALAAVVLGVVAGPAAKNAWARLAAPWHDTPRYTFTEIDKLPETMVIPHGEIVSWNVTLAANSRWQPSTATVEIPGMLPTVAKLDGDHYRFDLPARTEMTEIKIRVGDFYQNVTLDPKIRPELVAADASLQLPDYLQLPELVQRDVRSGTLSAVEGSTVQVTATASRELDSAAINKQPVRVSKASFGSEQVDVQDSANEMLLSWKDRFGLAAREPFELSIKPLVDEPPSVVTQEFPRQAVLLDTEQLNFQALSADDFGVKRIGMVWKGLDDRLAKSTVGEKVLAVGGPDQSSVQVPATFSAKSLGIEPQAIEVRLWVEDFLPDRDRVYSAPHVFFVLTPEQHAIWVTNQLSKWHRASLDVRDRELRLFERNKQLRAMTETQLNDDDMRQELRKQAGAEAANGRRLANLNKTGEDLLKMAARNPEIGVGHLERWAEMQQVLKDIAANRMPSVSDLLSKASADSKVARGEPSKPKPESPKAGQSRDNKTAAGGDPPEDDKEGKEQPRVPTIADRESSLQPLDDAGETPEEQAKKESAPRLTLPNTTIASPGKPPENPEACDVPEEAPVDEAIEEQADLLAEFEKLAEEMNTILANLEGSTLLKRLKAASREQDQVAEKISSRIDAVFGASRFGMPDDRKMLDDLAEIEKKSSQTVSYIMDDMQSYFERRRMTQFKTVLDEMREAEVLTALTELGDEIPQKQGMSIAQAEYWSDTFDRWADDLVDPACGGM